MKKTLKIIFGFACCTLYNNFIAQNTDDILRYSQLQYGGTARYHGLAGAFGAVGADFSVLSTNPAGMGRYRESDFSFTPTFNSSSNASNFRGNINLDGKQNFNINNIGIVTVSKASPESPSLWRAAQFGFGYNQLANFHNRTTISGINSNSVSQVFAADGFNVHPDDLQRFRPYGADPAYMTWLIDPEDDGGKTFYTTQMYADSIQHLNQLTTKGSMGEWVFAISGNYNDKLYIGGTVGFQRLRFEREIKHYEQSLIDSTNIHSFTYTENYATRGSGINLKLGAIFLPTKYLRIGAAYHTATNFYNMVDNFNTSIETNFRTITFDRSQYNYQAASPQNTFRYKMRTPSRIMGNIAFVIKKKGLISLDIERVNYGNGMLRRHKLSGDNYTFENENLITATSLNTVNNIRLGGEYRLTNLVMLRGGIARLQNGYNPDLLSETKAIMTYALGLGYRASSFFLDVAYTYTKSQQDYFMYDPILVSNSVINRSVSNIHATIGFKF